MVLRAHGAHGSFDEGVAAGKALLAQALEDLGRRIGIPRQQADKLRFARLECAGVRPWLAGTDVVLGQPVGHRARSERQFLGDLRGVQALGAWRCLI
jgi:hypothetical protein